MFPLHQLPLDLHDINEPAKGVPQGTCKRERTNFVIAETSIRPLTGRLAATRPPSPLPIPPNSRKSRLIPPTPG